MGGGARQEVGEGFYIEPTVFKGHNAMQIFQEEIFGPVLSVTTFKDFDEAIKIANDTIYGLGAGVWARSAHSKCTPNSLPSPNRRLKPGKSNGVDIIKISLIPANISTETG
jgi:hypothetical protein